MIKTEIIQEEIRPFKRENSIHEEGSELLFNGRVRAHENGERIIALEYEHYPGMAEKELQSLAEEALKRFPITDLFCSHRVGTVPVGEAALHVSIWSKHRSEGLEAMTWFITELKSKVPIWKWVIRADGTKVPSQHDH